MKKIFSPKAYFIFIKKIKIYVTFVVLALLSVSNVAFSQEKGDTVYRYNVRGTVSKLLRSEGKKPEISIRHEAITDYVNESGEMVGMSAMTMPFSISEHVSLDDLKVGDRVEFILESWWKPRPGDVITEIKKID